MPKLTPRPLFALAFAALLTPAPVLAQDATKPVTSDAGAYLAARISGSESDYRAAAGWYARALISDPTNPALLEGAVIANMGLGQFDAAAAIGRQLQQTGVKSQPAFVALLVDQTKREDYAGILADAAAGRSIGTLVDGLVLAWAELGNGRMSEAQQAFDKIATSSGLEVFGLYHKALALAAVGDYEGADEILSGRAKGSVQLLRRGVIAHAEILSQLERNPDAVAVLDTHFIPGRDAGIDALRTRLVAGEPIPYDVARTASEGIAEVFFTLASALNGEAENGFTLSYARAAAHLRPDHSEAILLAASLLEELGQHDLATETYALIPTTDPTYHIAEIGRSDALYAAGNVEASIETLKALTRSNGDRVMVQMALGDALRREQRFEEATGAYDAAIELATKAPSGLDWQLYFSRGICHERQKRWELAQADMRHALELSPDQPAVLNYLGYAYLELNTNLDEALSMIQRAAAARPESGAIVDSLAWGLYRLGRIDEALEPMERASQLEPVDPVVTDHLGDVYWAVGRKLEARFQWQRALSFDPEEKDALRIRKKLDVGLDAVLAEEGAKPLPAKTADGN
ncbi:MAG: tetratricopeptide repeat protein [Paracoccaceae bacterium]